MSQQLDFYLARAADARREADGAQLSNVRDRCLRAATAWEEMAARAARTEQSRAEGKARKEAAEEAAEQAA